MLAARHHNGELHESEPNAVAGIREPDGRYRSHAGTNSERDRGGRSGEEGVAVGLCDDVEIPVLVILTGVLLLVAWMPAIPIPRWIV